MSPIGEEGERNLDSLLVPPHLKEGERNLDSIVTTSLLNMTSFSPTSGIHLRNYSYRNRFVFLIFYNLVQQY